MIRAAHRRRRGLSRSAVRTLFFAGFVMAIAGLALAGHFAAPATYDGQPVASASSNGPAVALPAGATDANFADFAINDSALRIQTHGAGNATFVSSTSAFATANSLMGRWANLTNLDVSSTSLFVAADQRPAVNVSGDLTDFALRDTIAADDHRADFVYGGPSGTTNVTLRDLDADHTYFAYDSETDSILDTADSDADGTVTFADMPNSEHTVFVMTHPVSQPGDGQLVDADLPIAILMIALLALLAWLTVTLRSSIAMGATALTAIVVGLWIVGLVPGDLAVLLVVFAVVGTGLLAAIVWRSV